jgi:RNA polymerase sigma-70 factor (ECF subfamily)
MTAARFFPDDDDRNDLARPADAEVDRLFRDNYNQLCGFVYRYVRSHEIAEELVQDLFFNLWDRKRRGALIETHRSYLFTAARNLAINYLKRQGIEAAWRERAAREETRPQLPEDHLEANELASAVRAAIEGLPNRARLIFTMSRQQHLSNREIAQILGISVKTVEVQMGRALKSLRSSVARHMGRALLLVAGAGLFGHFHL